MILNREMKSSNLSRLRISRYYSRLADGQLVLQNEKRRVYNGMDVVQERDQNDNVTASYTRTGNIGGILARTTQAGSTFYGYDGAGNVVTLTNSAGAQVGSYTYDAFGNIVAQTGNAANDNPYRFSTKEQIGGLYSYGFRFYSPGLGRFINRDPLDEDGGTNLYGFVGNDPVNQVDMYGLVGGGLQVGGAANLGVASGVSGGPGVLGPSGPGFGLGGATSVTGGAGVFVPFSKPTVTNSSVAAYSTGGGFARLANRSLVTSTPDGHREGVVGVDAGIGGSGFITNADTVGELARTDNTATLNVSFLPIPTVPLAFGKFNISVSWGRKANGTLIVQGSGGGGAEYGLGSFSKYGTTMFARKSASIAQAQNWVVRQYRGFCRAK